ncbi:MAG: flagellar motor stator protein MotA [Holosporales bacterium]
MKFLIGIGVVLGCVLGGFLAHGGHIGVLWQPYEYLIIVGAGVGALIIGHPKPVAVGVAKSFGRMMKAGKYKKAHYIELLSCMYQVFRLIKSKGALAIESHVEKPEESTLFQQFPLFQHDHHGVEFMCDYLRMFSLGADNPHVMEDLMGGELEVHHAEEHLVPAAVQGLADGLPALGIVAAVLGVIHTMGSITEPPEVLGHLIGAALVGTFSGVLIAYGFVGPMATMLGHFAREDGRYLECIKAGMIAHLHNNPPMVSVEFARKILPYGVRPTFQELEAALETLPRVT